MGSLAREVKRAPCHWQASAVQPVGVHHAGCEVARYLQRIESTTLAIDRNTPLPWVHVTYSNTIPIDRIVPKGDVVLHQPFPPGRGRLHDRRFRKRSSN
jgi:hypothetical protein